MPKRVILVTGPPSNDRDDYLVAVLPKLRRRATVEYRHVFTYMQKASPSYGIAGLTRDNWNTASRSNLNSIRDEAFHNVSKDIRDSDNEIELVSTPSNFKVKPFGDYSTGEVEGLSHKHLKMIGPDLIVVLIDDLFRVRQRMLGDKLWSKITMVTLHELAKWRSDSIEQVRNYVEEGSASSPRQWLIFPREQPIDSFVDLAIGKKKLLYISHHITAQRPFKDVDRLIAKLSKSFICINPNMIKDWEVVDAYDSAVQKGNTDCVSVRVHYKDGDRTFTNIPVKEIEESMDVIRSQIKDRDEMLVSQVDCVVVYHRVPSPSYGVMDEVMFARQRVGRPVYVIFPFKRRPSPFFEQLVEPQNFIHGNITDREVKSQNVNASRIEKEKKRLEDLLLAKLKREERGWTVPVASRVRR